MVHIVPWPGGESMRCAHTRIVDLREVIMLLENKGCAQVQALVF